MLLDQQVTEGSISGKVAEKMRTGNEVDYSSLKVFGCLAYVHIPSEEWSKVDPKSKWCVFLGYGKWVKGYKFWDPKANKEVSSRDVVFHENSMFKSIQDEKQQVPKSSSSDK
jgi:hypothetical protein